MTEQNEASKKKPNRQKLRKARKQAEIEAIQQQAREEAANAPDRQQVEAEEFQKLLAEANLRIHPIAADGHCLFNALAHQLALEESVQTLDHQGLRSTAATYLRAHPDDFLPFLTSDATGDMMTTEEFEAYSDRVEKTALWGGQVEIMALSQALQRCICVYQPSSGKPLVIGEEYSGQRRPLRVSYHRHQFGLGEHYNSVIDS